MTAEPKAPPLASPHNTRERHDIDSPYYTRGTLLTPSSHLDDVPDQRVLHALSAAARYRPQLTTCPFTRRHPPPRSPREAEAGLGLRPRELDEHTAFTSRDALLCPSCDAAGR